MKKTLAMIALIGTTIGTTALAARNSENEAQMQLKQTQLEKVRKSVETMRDSLQLLIARQYSFKQKTVEQREADKEDLDRKAEQQARLMYELSRIKEERLGREQVLADERKNLTQKREEWLYLRTHIADIFQKDADGIMEAFPLDREIRRAELEKVRSALINKKPAADAFAAYVGYRMRWIAAGDSVGMFSAVVAPQEGAAVLLSIARFGNILGYGLDTANGNCYYLRQTGKLGAGKFSIDKIEAPDIVLRLGKHLREWSQTGHISGNIPVEMTQNDQTRSLIAGKKQSAWNALYDSLSKGGWVMIPMLLLPFWVLYLCAVKIVQYAGKGHQMKRQLRAAMRHLEKREYDSAMALVNKHPAGIINRIIQTCFAHRSHGRQSGERAVYELLSLEIPPITRSLNTLAVIAGAAPLLGLLGTISGMITLFAAVTHFGTGDPKFLAGGISEALITAKTGLAIAIPVLFIHDLLRGAKDRLVADMEKNGIAILNAIYPEE